MKGNEKWWKEMKNNERKWKTMKGIKENESEQEWINKTKNNDGNKSQNAHP